MYWRMEAGPSVFSGLQRRPSQAKTETAVVMCFSHSASVSAAQSRSSTYMQDLMPRAAKNCTISPLSAQANAGASLKPSGSPV